MRLAAFALLLLASPSAALAICPTPPVTNSATYDADAARHLLCLQQELSISSDALAEQTRRMVDQQRLDDLVRAQQQQLIVPAQPFGWPTP